MFVPRQTIEKLLWKLQNANGMIQVQAAQSLGQMRDPRAVLPLVAALNSDRRLLQLEAAQALANMGRAAVMPLILALREESSQVWMLASATLVKIGRPAVGPILSMLPDESVPVQILLMEVLGQIGDERAVDALIAALDSPEQDMRAVAAVALARIGAPAVRPVLAALSNLQNFGVQRHAADILRAIGEPALIALLTAVNEGSELERSQAAAVLGKIGTPAVPGLLELLEADDPRTRYTAAWALGCTGDETAVPALVRRLADKERSPLPNMRVCDVAAKALEVIGTPEAHRAVEAWQQGKPLRQTTLFMS